MILKILAVVVVLIVAVLLFAATKPSTFHIQRSLTMQAPADKIFPLIDDLYNWPRWAPQDRDDSTMRRSFSGAASGVGAMSSWSGTGSTGKGTMTITESTPQSITIAVDWTRPFAARNINQFTLEPDGNATKVMWSMDGPNLYMMKLMSVFTNMDSMMGQHFQEGLANLKAEAEK
jgi:hypothetical protein